MDVQFVDLPIKTVNALRRHANISTLEQLREVWRENPWEIECVRGIGPKTFKEIQYFMLKMEGINLVEEKPETEEVPVVEILTICRNCRVPLQRVKWNTKGDVLLCDNPHCSLYLEPQGFIQGGRSMEEVFS